MSFRASNVVTSDAFASIKRQFVATKGYLQTQRASMVQATCSSLVPYAVIQHFVQVIPLFDGWAATPGLAAYAQSQENDAGYNIGTEYTAARNALVAARDQLVTMFPKNGSNFLLYQVMAADGTVTPRTFTAAELAPAVTLLDSVIATIT